MLKSRLWVGRGVDFDIDIVVIVREGAKAEYSQVLVDGRELVHQVSDLVSVCSLLVSQLADSFFEAFDRAGRLVGHYDAVEEAALANFVNRVGEGGWKEAAVLVRVFVRSAQRRGPRAEQALLHGRLCVEFRLLESQVLREGLNLVQSTPD